MGGEELEPQRAGWSGMGGNGNGLAISISMLLANGKMSHCWHYVEMVRRRFCVWPRLYTIDPFVIPTAPLTRSSVIPAARAGTRRSRGPAATTGGGGHRTVI